MSRLLGALLGGGCVTWIDVQKIDLPGATTYKPDNTAVAGVPGRILGVRVHRTPVGGRIHYAVGLHGRAIAQRLIHSEGEGH